MERIEEPDFEPCAHREHLPPPHVALPPGLYHHSCPGCGYQTSFTVPGATWALS